MTRITPWLLLVAFLIASPVLAKGRSGFSADQRRRMNNWKPRTDAEQAAIIKRGDRHTWKTSGRSGSLGISGCNSNWKPGDYGYDPAKHACPDGASGSSRSSGSTKIDGIDGGGTIGSSQPPWKYRLTQARAQATDIPSEDLVGALDSASGAQIFAVLEQAYKRKVSVPERNLVSALGRSHDSQAAYAAAFQLAQHRTTTARDALARHVARGAAGHREVRKLLGPKAEEYVEAAREAIAQRSSWMSDAATGRPGSRSQMQAIQKLAGEPGGDVASLLRQLAGDSHQGVSKAASEALNKRRQAGL